MAIRISEAEQKLLQEIRELQFGELLDVVIPTQEWTVRIEILHRSEVRLINLVREYPEIEEIKVRDSLPACIMVGEAGKVSKRRRKRINC